MSEPNSLGSLFIWGIAVTELTKSSGNNVDYTLPLPWKAVIRDDETTSFEFVTFVLINIFEFEAEDAYDTAFRIQDHGQSVVYSADQTIVRTLVSQTNKLAKTAGHVDFVIECVP